LTSVDVFDRGASVGAGLRVVRELASSLDAAGVTYCHWKGNARLREAVLGSRDLDVLVDREASLELTRILAATGFKRFAQVPLAACPAIEDYLALDQDTGRLVHLHLHYRLTVGDNSLNGYRLPWEALVLSTRQFDAETAIWVADPHVELVLLLVRAALRLRAKDYLTEWLGRPRFGAQARAELRWLAARTDPDRLAALSEGLVGKEGSRLVLEMVSREPSCHRLGALRRRASPPLGTYRSYSPLSGAVRSRVRAGFGLGVAVNRKWLRSMVLPARILPNSGLVIAFLGDDERACKTAVNQIASWLTWKLDVIVLDRWGEMRQVGSRGRKAFRARSRGMIVLCHGVPEPQGHGPPAQPILLSPDLIIRLSHAPGADATRQTGQVEVARSRGGDPRTSGWPGTSQTVDIDPDDFPDRALLEIKRALWQQV